MLRFYYVDFKLVIVQSGQCTFQSLFPNFPVCFGWYFLVSWVGSFGGIVKFGFWSSGYSFFARDWNLYIIHSSHVVGAIVWSFIELDAAWHECVLIALAVVVG